VGKQKVLTMSTLLAADWVAKPADCLGFRMFLRVPSHCKGWNAVRVPPRAQHSPLSEGVFALTCGH
jgi:hypothetical protein